MEQDASDLRKERAFLRIESLIRRLEAFDPDQPRDPDGKFGDGSGSSGGEHGPLNMPHGPPVRSEQEHEDRILYAVKSKKAQERFKGVVGLREQDGQKVVINLEKVEKNAPDSPRPNEYHNVEYARGSTWADVHEQLVNRFPAIFHDSFWGK